MQRKQTRRRKSFKFTIITTISRRAFPLSAQQGDPAVARGPGYLAPAPAETRRRNSEEAGVDYLGSARFFARLGNACGEAMVELIEK